MIILIDNMHSYLSRYNLAAGMENLIKGIIRNGYSIKQNEDNCNLLEIIKR